LIAVIRNEKKDRIVKITANYSLYALVSVHWEISNTFYAMFKRQKRRCYLYKKERRRALLY